MLRLFLALRPPLPIREQLFDLMDGIGGARWQDDEQLHVTTRFLGEVDPRLADDIVTEIDRLRLSLTPVAPTVALQAVGQFASRGRTDTLWAGVTPHAALTALHRKVDQAVVRAGLPPTAAPICRMSRSPGCRDRSARRRRSTAGSPAMPGSPARRLR
ncbi:RNA 2',3'-cyclic phosphodiesterase [Sphingomonas aerolata]|uniref:RNA 2',3'-cyclic phosphodiesterase n=1 Tax=Sphingomonas aerolata TaxID=185951 RepID=UPI002FDFA465